MQPETLYFKSGIKTYAITSDVEPHCEIANGLTVSEKYWPRAATEPQIAAGVQNYEVVIEASVSTRDEATEARMKAFDLTRDLDRAWIYVCGEPLHPHLWSLNFLQSPEGWDTNAKEIDRKLASLEGQPYAVFGKTEQRHWLDLSFFPLQDALRVIQALNVASEATQALVDLHCGALKSRDRRGQLFLFAKGLELGAQFLGSDKKAREKAIPDEIKSGIKRGLDWLFNVSNNRFDIRHVVKDKATLDLHPKLTGVERGDFVHDADLIIRGVVCQQIGKAPFIVTPAA
ncbi:MAG: hypothetical protein M3447_11275 [Acidobacteriota bacterium]|nr:hypothetical protein [Acidobacteriota bacterium]